MNRHDTSTASHCGSLTIGGDKEHVVETIDGALLRLFRSCPWKPIPRCTGRYTCRDHGLSRLHPVDLAQQFALSENQFDVSGGNLHDDLTNHERRAPAIRCCTFYLPGRSDSVLVVPLDPTNLTGIISYRKQVALVEGSEVSDSSNAAGPARHSTFYVHTLNAPSGFRRKLEALGLTVTDEDVLLGE